MAEIDYSDPASWHVLLTDPLSQQTRKERRSFLGISLVGIVVGVTRLIPQEITALGIRLSTSDSLVFIGTLMMVTVYFFFVFLINSFTEFINRRRLYSAYESKLDGFQNSLEKLTSLMEPTAIFDELCKLEGNEEAKKGGIKEIPLLFDSLTRSFDGLPGTVGRLRDLEKKIEVKTPKEAHPDLTTMIVSMREGIKEEISDIELTLTRAKQEIGRARQNFLFRVCFDIILPVLVGLFALWFLICLLGDMPEPPKWKI